MARLRYGGLRRDYEKGGGTLHNALVSGKEAMKDTGVRGNHFLSKIIEEGKRNRLKGLGKCLRQKKDDEGFYIKILGWF